MRNESALLKFWIRHYDAFADEIHFFDDGSDDGSREIIAGCPKATLHDAGTNGLDEVALLELAHESYKLARGKADWVIWPDLDEFVYHPNIARALSYHAGCGHDVIRPAGFNMVGCGLPEDDGVRQIWELLRTGVPAPVYSKPIVFNPNAEIKWYVGKHVVYKDGLTVSPWGNLYQPDPWRLRLLHYRYLGSEYTKARNARQFARSTDKGGAWTCAPEYQGEHNPEWAEKMIDHAYDVVCPEVSYRLINGIWPKLPSDL